MEIKKNFGKKNEEYPITPIARGRDGEPLIVGKLKLWRRGEGFYCRERCVICFGSVRSLFEALPYIEAFGSIAALICPCAMPEEIAARLAVSQTPAFCLDDGTQIADADGRIALIDSSRGVLTVDPSLDQLERYSQKSADHSPLKDVRCGIMLDGSQIETCTAPHACSLLCNADELARGADFYERMLFLAENCCTQPLCIELNAANALDDGKICERAEAIFRAAVYGEVSVLMGKYRSVRELESSFEMMHKSFCRLCEEGREVNGQVARGILVSSPIWLYEAHSLPRADFICFDFDLLCERLLGVGCGEIERSDEARETLCRVWESYRRACAPHEKYEKRDLRAKSRRLFSTKLFVDWVEFMGIGEIYLPEGAIAQKNS